MAEARQRWRGGGGRQISPGRPTQDAAGSFLARPPAPHEGEKYSQGAEAEQAPVSARTAQDRIGRAEEQQEAREGVGAIERSPQGSQGTTHSHKDWPESNDG